MAIASQDTVTTQAGAKTATPTAPTVLKVGSRGGDVKLLQTWLNQLGYNAGAEDGKFGSATATALKAFQTASGLQADAKYGSNTAAALQQAILARKAQNQLDYYAVTGATAPAPTAPVVDKSAQMMQAETQPVTPPSPQQLGAAAEANAQRTQLAQSGQLGMMTPDQVASINKFNQIAPQPADVQVASQQVQAQPDFYAVVDPAQQAQAQSDYYAVVDQQKQSESMIGTAQTNQAATVTAVPQEQKVPVKDITPKAPTLVSAGGGMATTATPNATIGGASQAAPQPSQASLETIANASAYQQMSNDLFNRLNTMQTEWSPETDPDYQRDAVSLENQVAQMMVARGGLYSSVARAALQTSLVSLQSNYRKQAYERFIQERDFVFKQLQFVSDRLDAEFSKAMTQKNYELAVQKEQFDQNMAIAQFNADQAYRKAQLGISRANAENAKRQADYQMKLADAAQKQQAEYNRLANIRDTAIGETAQYNKYFDEWKNTGYLSVEGAAYLGINSYQGLGSNDSPLVYTSFANKKLAIQDMTNQANVGLRALGDAEVTLGTYDTFMKQNTGPKSTTISTDIYDEAGNKIGTKTEKYGE